MDSVTQLVLGAAVGEAVIGRQVGRKAILWGALAGTLPDLDVFIQMGDAVSDFTYHRSFSHSLFVLAVITPLMVWLVNRMHPSNRQHTMRWGVMFYAVFATHVLLDSFTAYGTQIFWPLVTTPMTWSTIFIIDPAYTLPLLIGVLVALILNRQSGRGHWINGIGLALSTIYLAWTLVAKIVVERRIERALDNQQVSYRSIFTVPSPFNSLLWRTVIMTDSGYYEVFHSLFDDGETMRLSHYASDENLLVDLEDHWPVQRLQWFSKGFYAVNLHGDDVIIRDLRMGLEPNYVFSFKVAERGNPHVKPSPPERVLTQQDLSLLPLIWDRIWDQSVNVGLNERMGTRQLR